MPGYVIACRLCGKGETLGSVPALASWYLIHAVQEHWDLIEVVHEATPDMVGAALMMAAGAGWLEDAKTGDNGGG
jgi:hypothetical protein